MPRLIVHLSAIRRNAAAICRLCKDHGIQVAGVVKGACGALPVTNALLDGGCTQIASSRLSQLSGIKASMPQTETLLIRMPAPEEAAQVVSCCDLSLNTEADTLRALSAAALAANTTHGVILMYELGDLREGLPTLDSLLELARLAESLPGLHLAGIGGTLNDIYGISPTKENMGALADAFHAVEQAVGRKLDILSGGSTTALPMLLTEGLPPEINHLRVGEGILNGRDLTDLWKVNIPDTTCETMELTATVIECNRKPTIPWGLQRTNGFGETPPLPPDRGVRKRVILDVGRCDVGEVSQLICPEGVSIIGASSDHLVADVEDYPADLQVGDTLSFRLYYQGMLYAFSAQDVEKIYIESGPPV